MGLGRASSSRSWRSFTSTYIKIFFVLRRHRTDAALRVDAHFWNATSVQSRVWIPKSKCHSWTVRVCVYIQYVYSIYVGCVDDIPEYASRENPCPVGRRRLAGNKTPISSVHMNTLYTSLGITPGGSLATEVRRAHAAASGNWFAHHVMLLLLASYLYSVMLSTYSVPGK